MRKKNLKIQWPIDLPQYIIFKILTGGEVVIIYVYICMCVYNFYFSIFRKLVDFSTCFLKQGHV